jgi:hypothetical protein
MRFCVRCHTPLRYTCPACGHVQMSGGVCDRCGVDFVKYGVARLAALQTEMEQQRERTKNRAALVKSVLLAPLTGGYSLITYFRNRRRGD